MYLYDHPPSASPWAARTALGEFLGSVKRRRIDDSTQGPYRWICALDVQFPARDKTRASIQGTGLLISPRHVLTSARNVVRAEPPFKESQLKTGFRVDAQRVAVTPALDGTPELGKKRAPVGSIELQPPAWWIPSQFFSDLSFKWDVAVLTLPRELPAFRGVPYGHWGHTGSSPRTTIKAATNESLVGATLTTCGYTDGVCFDEVPLPTASNPFPQPTEPTRMAKRGNSTQWETFGRVQPSQRGLVEWGQLLYDTAACYGMDGAPVWLNTGSLQLVAIHVGTNFRNITNPDIPPQLGVALALRSEILDLLRQRVALAGIRPAF